MHRFLSSCSSIPAPPPPGPCPRPSVCRGQPMALRHGATGRRPRASPVHGRGRRPLRERGGRSREGCGGVGSPGCRLPSVDGRGRVRALHDRVVAGRQELLAATSNRGQMANSGARYRRWPRGAAEAHASGARSDSGVCRRPPARTRLRCRGELHWLRRAPGQRLRRPGLGAPDPLPQRGAPACAPRPPLSPQRGVERGGSGRLARRRRHRPPDRRARRAAPVVPRAGGPAPLGRPRPRLPDPGRWCPLCWAGDGEPYDRKVWWLSVVDVCPAHACLLESRCGTCGRLQPSLTRGVRLTACSYCGHDLAADSSATVLPSGAPADRRLWYARQAADLVHAAEVIALMQCDETASLGSAYARFAAKARGAGLRDVASEFDKMHTRRTARAGWVEALFSALWRFDEEVVALFSPPVQEAVRGTHSSSG